MQGNDHELPRVVSRHTKSNISSTVSPNGHEQIHVYFIISKSALEGMSATEQGTDVGEVLSLIRSPFVQVSMEGFGNISLLNQVISQINPK